MRFLHRMIIIFGGGPGAIGRFAYSGGRFQPEASLRRLLNPGMRRILQ